MRFSPVKAHKTNLILLLVLLMFSVCSTAYGADNAKQVTILTYHHLAPRSADLHCANGAVVPVEEFEQHLKLIEQLGYHTITTNDLLGWLSGELQIPARSVLITFDDGYESVYSYAYPLLAKYRMNAAVFIIGARDRSGHAMNEISFRHLTWVQISEMHMSGAVEIQSHTFGAHDMKEEGRAPLLEWTEVQIESDAARLNGALALRGVPAPIAIAYPWGKYSPYAVTSLAQAGLQMGFTLDPGKARPGTSAFQIPRVVVYPGTTPRDLGRILEK